MNSSELSPVSGYQRSIKLHSETAQQWHITNSGETTAMLPEIKPSEAQHFIDTIPPDTPFAIDSENGIDYLSLTSSEVPAAVDLSIGLIHCAENDKRFGGVHGYLSWNVYEPSIATHPTVLSMLETLGITHSDAYIDTISHTDQMISSVAEIDPPPTLLAEHRLLEQIRIAIGATSFEHMYLDPLMRRCTYAAIARCIEEKIVDGTYGSFYSWNHEQNTTKFSTDDEVFNPNYIYDRSSAYGRHLEKQFKTGKVDLMADSYFDSDEEKHEEVLRALTGNSHPISSEEVRQILLKASGALSFPKWEAEIRKHLPAVKKYSDSTLTYSYRTFWSQFMQKLVPSLPVWDKQINDITHPSFERYKNAFVTLEGNHTVQLYLARSSGLCATHKTSYYKRNPDLTPETQ